MSDYDPKSLRPDEDVREGARRVAIDALYESRDTGGNMHDAGAAAADAVLALLEPIDVHIVDVGTEFFTVTHPLTERALGSMHECGLHKWMSAQDGPPVSPGRYHVVEQDGDPVAPWLFTDIEESA